jgi:hypothetical protein
VFSPLYARYVPCGLGDGLVVIIAIEPEQFKYNSYPAFVLRSDCSSLFWWPVFVIIVLRC